MDLDVEEKMLFKEDEDDLIKKEPPENPEEITCTPCIGEPFPPPENLPFRKVGSGGLVECGICFRKVKEAGMRQHSRTHAGLRPFPCDECDARFTRRSDVFRHHRVMHRRQKPFPCPLCPKRFSSRHLLEDHVAGHEAGYECKSCHFKFGKKEYYDSHVQFIHPESNKASKVEGEANAPLRKAKKEPQRKALTERGVKGEGGKVKACSEDMILRVLEESVRQSRSTLSALARTTHMHSRSVTVAATMASTDHAQQRCKVQLVMKQPFEVLSEGGTALLVGVVGDTIGGDIHSVTIKT